MQVTIFIVYKRGNQFGKNPLILSIYIAINLFSLPSESAVYTVQPVLIPSSLFPDLFIFSDIATSTSPASRNCFIHPLLSIHCVILVTSSELFIMASYNLSLARRRKSPLPFAHCGHANTMCLTFGDGYPCRELGFSALGTLLLYR